MSKHESLVAALVAVQGKLPAIAKTNQVKAGAMSYSYADLTQVSEVVLPLLSAHGLAFVAMPTFTESGGSALHYKLVHESGEFVEGWYPLPSNVRPQELGSAITYARRYALCAVTGVAPGGDDDDAQRVQKAEPVKVPVPDFFVDQVAGADLDVLRKLHREASQAGFLPAVEDAINKRRKMLGA